MADRRIQNLALRPDLRITGISQTPAAPSAKTTFSAAITVENQGTVAADGGRLVVWAYQNVTPTCGTKGNQSVAVGTLAAGEHKTFNVTGLPAPTAGAMTLRALVDGTCTAAELDETNNQAAAPYRVLAPADDPRRTR